MDRPETRFAWNRDVSLAYQVCGQGPTDLIYLQGYCSNVDMNWESPYLSRFLLGLAARTRLIITDRRGWGCSANLRRVSVWSARWSIRTFQRQCARRRTLSKRRARSASAF